MKIEATIKDPTAPIDIDHKITLEASIGDDLIKLALEHWKSDYDGAVRSKVIWVKIVKITEEDADTQ